VGVLAQTQDPSVRCLPCILISYGVLRFLVEFTRQPDAFLVDLPMGWSMGQWLSLPMIVGGLVMLAWAYRPGRKAAA
jgi:phosphatidylglycerol:prolipoprotein diacylglycerol transferase